LDRTKLYPDASFVIIGVNQLSSVLREQLLQFQYDIIQMDPNDCAKMGTTTLLFTANLGVELFSFLNSTEYSPDSIISEDKFAAIIKEHANKRNIASFKYVTGCEGNNVRMSSHIL
jgi:hypothetical protein